MLLLGANLSMKGADLSSPVIASNMFWSGRNPDCSAGICKRRLGIFSPLSVHFGPLNSKSTQSG
jgi:hypothetical protein